jgi:hypothetical protein
MKTIRQKKTRRRRRRRNEGAHIVRETTLGINKSKSEDKKNERN